MNSPSVLAKASSVARRLRCLSSPASPTTITTLGEPSLPATSFGSSTTASTSSTRIMTQQRRWLGSGGGARGARGHGWWINYRAGKGGRHLQGTYSHLDLDAMTEWNDAIFCLGSKLAYLDVKLESLAGMDDVDEADNENNQQEQTTVRRLTLELATEALPLVTENVLKLLGSGERGENENENESNEQQSLGYLSSTLHRIEKGVGILGGLVADNPNHQSLNPNAPTSKKKMGMCHPSFRAKHSPNAMDISSEHLVVNHLEGVVTMLQPRIGEVDSRFMLLSHNAPHLDGVSVAMGRLANPESLQALREWESTLITSHGVPTNAVLKIVGCGLLNDDDEEEDITTTTSISGGTSETVSESKKEQHASTMQ